MIDIFNYTPTGHNVFSFAIGTLIGTYKFVIQGFSPVNGTLGFINLENTLEVAWFALVGGFFTAFSSSFIKYLAKKIPLWRAKRKRKRKLNNKSAL